MNNQPIGVFDSGVGGLSVLSEIHNLLPNETTLFVADQAYVPYGGKTQEELLDRVGRIIEFLKEKNAKAVVIACNTATIYTIEQMRQKFQIPIIGTVPVIKTIAGLTKSGKTAVFSTPATAKSPYLQELIDKFANGANVIKIGGSNLEELIEEGELNSTEVEEILQKELKPLLKQGVDAIALGCTHYPFLRKRIEEIVGPGVAVVDSGGAVARRLKQVLQYENLLSLQKRSDEYYTTGDSDRFSRVAELLLGKKVVSVSHINL